MTDDELEDLPPPLVGVEDYDTDDEARAAARELVEHGIGASVEAVTVIDEVPLDDNGEPTTDPAASDPATSHAVLPLEQTVHRVLVLEHEEQRALEVLGLVEPLVRPEANPEEPMKVDRGKVPWKLVLPIYLLALIVLPALAFWVTYLIISRP